MRGFEKFGLISGIVGLVADLIALGAFLIGFFSFGEVKGTLPSKPLFLIVTALLLLYGWLSLAWVFARHGLSNMEPAKRRKALGDVISKAAGGIGLLLFPLDTLWLIAVSTLGDDPIRVADMATEGAPVLSPWPMYIVYFVLAVVVLGFGVAVVPAALMPLVYEDLA